MHYWRMDEELFHCWFETSEGLVLRTEDGWETPEEAAHWGQRVLDHPDEFTLFDPDGMEVDGDQADPDRGFNVEQPGDAD